MCGLPKAKKFGDFSDLISEDKVSQLAKTYKHVDDVDLYLGGLLEKPMSGSMLGQTFTCLISDQMYRTKMGDRFFYSLINTVGGSNQGE